MLLPFLSNRFVIFSTTLPSRRGVELSKFVSLFSHKFNYRTRFHFDVSFTQKAMFTTSWDEYLENLLARFQLQSTQNQNVHRRGGGRWNEIGLNRTNKCSMLRVRYKQAPHPRPKVVSRRFFGAKLQLRHPSLSALLHSANIISLRWSKLPCKQWTNDSYHARGNVHKPRLWNSSGTSVCLNVYSQLGGNGGWRKKLFRCKWGRSGMVCRDFWKSFEEENLKNSTFPKRKISFQKSIIKSRMWVGGRGEGRVNGGDADGDGDGEAFIRFSSMWKHLWFDMNDMFVMERRRNKFSHIQCRHVDSTAEDV